jgi:hypothetical protein
VRFRGHDIVEQLPHWDEALEHSARAARLRRHEVITARTPQATTSGNCRRPGSSAAAPKKAIGRKGR